MQRLFAMAMVVLTGALVQGADWPQWRGVHRDGVWGESQFPEKFRAETLKPRWRQPLGGGYSGIAVSNGLVYTMDLQKKPRQLERVLCLDAASGKTLWVHSYPVDYQKMEYGNGPRATPTVHKGRVYTFGARGHLFCLDARSGKVLWARDTVKDFKGRIPTWGHACSPLIHEGKLLVQVGGQPDACLVAFDPETGKELWHGLEDPPGYASPVIAQGKGWQLLVYWTPENVVGMDLATGKVRWKVPFKITYGVSISDLVWHDDVLLASDYWFGTKAITLDARGENPRVIWEGKRLSLLMSTPLWRAGHVYALDRNQGLKCVELKTGKVKWEGEHVTPRGRNPQATLVWVGKRALIFNEKGELILARLGPERYEEISRTRVLDGETWAHPAYAEGCIFIRTDEEILCVPLTGSS